MCIRWGKIEGRYFREPYEGVSACAGRAPGGQNFTCFVESGPKKFCRLAGSWRVNCAHQMEKKSTVGIFVNSRGESKHAQGGSQGPKFNLLGRIGPKNVLQTCSELASRLPASDGQKSKVGIFVNPRGESAHAQGGPQRAEISTACSNRAQKRFAHSQQAGESIARITWEKIEGRYFREP